MKNVWWFGLIVAALIVQATLMPLLTIKGVRPDLLLIIVVSTGLLMGKEAGVGIGFMAGMLQDLASGNIFGVNILSKLAIGYLFGLVEQKVFKEHILLPLLAVLLATVANSMIVLAVLWLLGYQVSLTFALYNSIAPLIAYNMVLAVPVHRLVYSLSKIN